MIDHAAYSAAERQRQIQVEFDGREAHVHWLIDQGVHVAKIERLNAAYAEIDRQRLELREAA